jgi:L-ascorbate metabolism protein UlaG (beta-lactamase superfamily)
MRLPILAALASLATTLAPATPAAADAPAKTVVTWYGHAAFTLTTPGGTAIVIDPFFANPKSPDAKAAETLPKVDYILVTHGHGDHVGDAVALAKRTGAKLISNFDLCKSLVSAGFPADQATGATCGNIGGSIAAGDATVNLVPAVHSSGMEGDKGGGNPMGMVIQVKGGPTIYHTGDTDVFGDMKLIPERWGPVQVMLSCIGGHFTMDPRGAALAASYVKPKTIVPMHFQTFPLIPGSPEELKKYLAPGIRLLVMEPGKAVSF